MQKVLIEGEMYFINEKDNQPIHINIQALIGKNGERKSTIVELMLRVLNNFACFFGFYKNNRLFVQL